MSGLSNRMAADIPGFIKNAAKAYYRIKGYYPVKVNGERFRVDPHHPRFWRSVNRGRFEKVFYDTLDARLGQGDVYCDIGSWIGPTAIFAARRCREVHCFEPDPVAYPYLLQNIGRNGLSNVRAYAVAIAARDGIVRMASHGGNLGDSMTSMMNTAGMSETAEVKAMRWDSWLKEHRPGRIAFIKMDIEGAETEVVPDMMAWLQVERPVLHLSVHGPWLPEGERMGSLRKLFASLAFYSGCYDDLSGEVAIGDDLAGQCAGTFRSLLFIP